MIDLPVPSNRKEQEMPSTPGNNSTETEVKPKAAVGRPKITTLDFPSDWQDRVLAEFKMGASREEIYAMLDISDKTFARLMRDDKEFFRTIKTGERYSQAWWLAVGRTQLRNKDFSYVGWYMNMKNRFQWADKTENKHSIEVVTPILGGLTKKQDELPESTDQD